MRCDPIREATENVALSLVESGQTFSNLDVIREAPEYGGARYVGAVLLSLTKLNVIQYVGTTTGCKCVSCGCGKGVPAHHYRGVFA